VPESEAETEQLEAEIAEVCELLHATTGRLVELIAPETKAALEAGEIGEDQAALICRKAPPAIDGEVAQLARTSTVTGLSRALSTAVLQIEQPEERRRVSFGYTEEGEWSLSALLPADEGALWERALATAREELFRAGEQASASWPDAFVAVADRSVAAAAARRPHVDRHLVLLHVETEANQATGHLHLGPALPPGLCRFLSCDSRVRPVLEAGGKAVSVGRAFRTVPGRTRTAVEDRDRGCRVPGCERDRWLHIHHIEHWENGGASDTNNLICLCSRHHPLHHLGKPGIKGNANGPGGVRFTDEQGQLLAGGSPPTPP
jgi:hypothetical protein